MLNVYIVKGIERLSASTETEAKFGICCGQIKFPPFRPPPPSICSLLCGVTPEAKSFRQHIRMYNSALAFSSIGASINETISGKGVYSFNIQGQLHHRMDSLLPNDTEKP